MLCHRIPIHKKKKPGLFLVYLNVYDLTPINGYAYWLGLGVFHSGVQVHDVEYGFGAHERNTTGIFVVEPRNCPGFTFRKSILIGSTNMNPKDVRILMEKLAEEYSGNTYHLIQKNCNHFCRDFCLKLTGKSIPPWVNRLARLGYLCNCVLPQSLNEKKISKVSSDRMREDEKKKIRSQSSSRYEVDSSNKPLSSSQTRHCVSPPSSIIINVSSTTTIVVK
ncbi:PREDICTED: deSI-like protein At4g17486 [Lupinus angustifolius]|uniref:deSI-like protein At4g17486 n=1 Tax=Lupinus angustifolius TaxID=3871 RepID=UPI00092F1CA4|nr:PREDICTED: deSI-like protein At4g17486 [Lupinus angustifolius]